MNGTPRRLALLLTLLLAAASCAAAQTEGNPPDWCRNGAFVDDAKDFRLARVKGERGGRAYFYKDDEGCPRADARCRARAYVIPGDELIVSRTFGDWACAWFQPRQGAETVGWIEAARLEINGPDARPPAAGWLGEWEFYHNSLSIRRGSRAGLLAVEGEAFWQGLGDNVHTGNVGGEAAPEGPTLTLADDICRITLRLVGPYLVADDNNDCGGANVTFDGVYRKRIKN